MVVSTTASSGDADSQQTLSVSEKTEDDNANGQDQMTPNQAGGGGEGKEVESGNDRPTPDNARASTSAAQAYDETHSQLYSKVQKATEKYRAMTVPEMVSGEVCPRVSAEDSATGTTIVMHMLSRNMVPQPARRSYIE